MTEVQERLLVLLKEIDILCRANDITYYLAAGSAIGAVRDHGFLPWDDDADVFMTSENYDKFCSIRNQFNDGRALISMDESYDCAYTIARYADITTTRISRYMCSSPQEGGVIVDIIVLDHVPDDEECIRNYITDLTAFSNILVQATSHSKRCVYEINDQANYKMLDELGRQKTLDILKEKLFRNKDTRGGVLIQRDPTVPHVWDENIFGEPVYVPFEDTELPIASRIYDQLVESFNEDWMYVPEAIERQEHMHGVIFDISNNNVLEDYKRTVDYKHYIEVSEKQTRFSNLSAPIVHSWADEKLKVAEVDLKLYYSKREAEVSRLDRLLEERKHVELDQFFDKYARCQLHKDAVGNVAVDGWYRKQKPYYFDISDDFLYVFLRNLMRKPQLGKAHTILNARLASKEGSPLTDELVTVIDTVRKASSMFQDKKYQEIRDIISPLYKKYPENLELRNLYFASGYYLADTVEKRERLLNEIDGLIPEDLGEGVVLCVKGEILWQLDRIDDAVKTFTELAEGSSHGIALLHVRDKLGPLTGKNESFSKLYDRISYRLGAEKVNSDAEGENSESEGDKSYLTDKQYVQMELLSEIDQICNDNNLQYFLGTEIAYEAIKYNGLANYYDTITVYMPAADIYRFIDAVKKLNRKDRYVESLLNNPDFPYVSVNYGSSDTLDLNMNRFGYFSHFGIYIDIQILRPEQDDSKAASSASDAENGWERTHMLKDESEITSQREQMESSRRMQRLLGKNFAAKITFKRCVKKSRSSSYYIKKRWSAKETVYPKSFFDDYKMIDFEGRKFRIPSDTSLYLAKNKGSISDDSRPQNERDPFGKLVDAEIPYKEFFAEARAEGIDFDDLWEMRKKVYRVTRPEKLATTERKKAWDYIFLCCDRYAMWDKYENRKQFLADLYDRKEFDALGEELDEYINLAISSFREKKLGLCFDKDIFDYMAAVLVQRGDGKLAEKIRKSVPENHWDDIHIIDYKGNYQ